MTPIERAEELRRRGRADDAVAILAQAVADGDQSAATHAYLGVALLDAGHPKAAVATLLGALLDVHALPGHEVGLAAIQLALLEADVPANSQA